MRALACLVFLSNLTAAGAQTVRFDDPADDDHGPGTYKYPTDTVYRRHSFDLRQFELRADGAEYEVSATVGADLDDPWRMEAGFAIQMVFVFVDTDRARGFTEGLPGLNVSVAPSDAWDRVIVLSPQRPDRVRAEIKQKLPEALWGSVVVPERVRGEGRTIRARVPRAVLGDGDAQGWGYQVVVQSNEGFPAGADLLTRKVNEYEGQHRFGGGTDHECDPHVIDVLAGSGTGASGEVAAQHEMLRYRCGENGESLHRAVLRMVRLAR